MSRQKGWLFVGESSYRNKNDQRSPTDFGPALLVARQRPLFQVLLKVQKRFGSSDVKTFLTAGSSLA